MAGSVASVKVINQLDGTNQKHLLHDGAEKRRDIIRSYQCCRRYRHGGRATTKKLAPRQRRPKAGSVTTVMFGSRCVPP